MLQITATPNPEQKSYLQSTVPSLLFGVKLSPEEF
jgi:hypothetical protein